MRSKRKPGGSWERLGPHPSKGIYWILNALVIVGIIATLFATGCGDSPDLPTTSMKGWELYSWQENGRWYFSLLEGTNRTKTAAEIHAADVRLDGIDGLKPALQGVAAGQSVTWWSPSWAEGSVGFPPAETVERVRQLCIEQELQLQVVTQGP